MAGPQICELLNESKWTRHGGALRSRGRADPRSVVRFSGLLVVFNAKWLKERNFHIRAPRRAAANIRVDLKDGESTHHSGAMHSRGRADPRSVVCFFVGFLVGLIRQVA